MSVTQIWRTLAGVSLNGTKVKWRAINPNSMHPSMLCGYRGHNGDWVPGALANIARDFMDPGDKERRWIVIDGEANPDWMGLMAGAMDLDRTLRYDIVICFWCVVYISGWLVLLPLVRVLYFVLESAFTGAMGCGLGTLLR